MDAKLDMIIVGAGLSGLLTAWRCLDVNPQMKILVIEANDEIGGDHTWSFNLTDVEDRLQAWVKPFIAYQWPRYDVKFPRRERTLEIPYCTGNSDSLRQCVEPHIETGRLVIKQQTSVSSLQSESVTLENGQELKAKYVLDARGFEPRKGVHLGYQKFMGRVIRTHKPHGLKHPIIMDARVEQIDGYRFVYCLPFTAHDVLIEDTYYSDNSDLSENEIVTQIDNYIQVNDWSDHKVLRQEKGVLPITLAMGDVKTPLNSLGLRGGFYHAVTGYSFPDALKVADQIATSVKEEGINDTAVIETKLKLLTSQHKERERFLRLLNRMLFRACHPKLRYKVLQRFYGLPKGLIQRFYSGQLTVWDKARILIGKPPVPVYRALYNFSEKAFIRREIKKRDLGA